MAGRPMKVLGGVLQLQQRLRRHQNSLPDNDLPPSSLAPYHHPSGLNELKQTRLKMYICLLLYDAAHWAAALTTAHSSKKENTT